MKRSVFFLITAILAFLFGALMFFTPARAAEGFGMVATAETGILFRILGSLLLSMGFLNLVVRNHAGSPTLKAVLGTNIMVHTLGMFADTSAIAGGALQFSKVVPGMVVHLFVGLGSLIYILKMERT